MLEFLLVVKFYNKLLLLTSLQKKKKERHPILIVPRNHSVSWDKIAHLISGYKESLCIFIIFKTVSSPVPPEIQKVA
jgi:hypothetical protein